MVLLLVASVFSDDAMTCEFPDFVQSDGSAEGATGRRNWRTHWHQHVVHHHDDDDESASTTSTSAEMFFDGSMMRSVDATPPHR